MFGSLNDLSIQCMTVNSHASKIIPVVADRCLTDASLPCFFFLRSGNYLVTIYTSEIAKLS